MPKKKESVWTIGFKGPIGPWAWNVWVKGFKNPQRVIAFDLRHIQNQLEGKIVLNADDRIKVDCSVADKVSVTMSYMEIT